jgi:hypothetical protein
VLSAKGKFTWDYLSTMFFVPHMLSRNGEETAVYYSQMAFENVTDIGSGLWLSEENLIWTRRLLGYLLTAPLASAFVCSLPHTKGGFLLDLTSKSGSRTIFIYLLHPIILNAISQGYKFFYSEDLLITDDSHWWLLVLVLTPLLATALASDTCVKYTSPVLRPAWLARAFCRDRSDLAAPGVVLGNTTRVSPTPGVGSAGGRAIPVGLPLDDSEILAGIGASCGPRSSGMALKFDEDE